MEEWKPFYHIDGAKVSIIKVGVVKIIVNFVNDRSSFIVII